MFKPTKEGVLEKKSILEIKCRISSLLEEFLFEAISNYRNDSDQEIGYVFKKSLSEKEQKRANIRNSFKHYLKTGLTGSKEVFKLEVR